MNLQILNEVRTPAFVYDENKIIENLDLWNSIKQSVKCKILFSTKSFSTESGIKFISRYVDGFGVSSLFEAKFARSNLGLSKSVHLVTPGVLEDEIDELVQTCDYITFNSILQLERFKTKVIRNKVSIGLRINPKISFLNDDRYDPCRIGSKLGVEIDSIKSSSLKYPIEGLHIHNNCESTDFIELEKTFLKLESNLNFLLKKLKWLNLGGGYICKNFNIKDLECCLALIEETYPNLEIFLEPGKGIVGDAGYLVASVVDILDNNVVILDTTVNHLPSAFEYNRKFDFEVLSGEVLSGGKGSEEKFQMAGRSCLAGDLLGSVVADLNVGDKIVFKGVGAYQSVKWSWFNGINLPLVYSYGLDGRLVLRRIFSYKDFLISCGG